LNVCFAFYSGIFFGDYREDIGKLKSFYDANMALNEEVLQESRF